MTPPPPHILDGAPPNSKAAPEDAQVNGDRRLGDGTTDFVPLPCHLPQCMTVLPARRLVVRSGHKVPEAAPKVARTQDHQIWKRTLQLEAKYSGDECEIGDVGQSVLVRIRCEFALYVFSARRGPLPNHSLVKAAYVAPHT